MKKNIVLINRWGSAVGFTDFGDYIDHQQFRVHYIVPTSSAGAIRVPASLYGSLTLLDELNFDAVSETLHSIIVAFGQIERLIAMAEKDLMLAGMLRDSFGIAGQNFEHARRFIDKGIMKSKIAQNGIATPKFKHLIDGIEGLNFPLILKPKRESSSRGVTKVLSQAEFKEKLPIDRLEDYMVEEFCADQVYHLDGFVFCGRIMFQASNQYIGNCLNHSLGEPLGSVQVTDPHKKQIFQDFAGRVIEALGLNSGTFHLECFLGGLTPIFLEIAARAGGGDIREVIWLAHHFNIVKAWIDAQLAQVPQLPDAIDEGLSSGFLIFPGPPEPKTIARVTSFRNAFPCIRKEYLPPEGHRLTGAGDIFTNSVARYLFVGQEEEIRGAIEAIKSSFRVTYESEPGVV